MKYLNITCWKNIFPIGKAWLGIGCLVMASLLSCTDDVVTPDAWTLEDSIKNSVHYKGVIASLKRPMTTRSLIMQGNGNKAVSINKFSDFTPMPTWLNTRCTVDSLSNWKGMANRKVTIKIKGITYGNFFVGEEGDISAPMGPFVFGPHLSGSSAIPAEAWYPTTGTIGLDTFAVKKDQSLFENLEASDLLYGVEDVSTNIIEFEHEMAQIEMHIHMHRYVTMASGTDTLTSQLRSVKLANCFTAGTIDTVGPVTSFAAGKIVPDMKSMDTINCFHYEDSDKFYTDRNGNDSNIYCYKGLIFPQDTTMKIILNVSGTEYEGFLDKYKYHDGVLYNINVDLIDEMKFFLDDTCHVGDFLCITEDGLTARAFADSVLDSAYRRGYHPIGIIFADTTSMEDRLRGWTHGYAVALDYAPTGSGSTRYYWTNNNNNISQATQYVDNWQLAMRYLNGYDETHRVTNNSSYNSTSHPAFFAAVNYNSHVRVSNEMVKAGSTSGWFLPSFGQEYLIMYNLGKPTSTVVTNGSWYHYWANMTATLRTNTNALLNKAKPYLPYYNDFYSSDRTWTSTEGNNERAYHMYFVSYTEWGVNWGKTSVCDVRPVIAF